MRHTNVFAGGHLLATYDAKGTHFHFNDPLGTRRAQASGAGVLEETCTSLPFGDSLNCTPTSAPTAEDATEQHFTGKERDVESGLDYFEARYYSSGAGIFISPDWSSSTVPVPYSDLKNPQSLNLYSYVENNPVTHSDLTGHVAVGIVLLAEVLALRTIFLNLMFSLLNGKPVTPEAMQELIGRAGRDKARKAMETYGGAGGGDRSRARTRRS